MDKMYGLQPPPASDYYAMTTSPESLMLPPPYQSYYDGDHSHHNRNPFFGSDELISAASAISSAACGRRSDESHNDVIKARIASHPFYPKLLEAYIDCQKVGAPPEIARILDEIRRENDGYGRNSASTCLGSDPELDEFMVGAPPEIARILDEMRRENDGYGRDSVYKCLGSDPELDEFMESFYDILVKYKSDLARTFDEASEFLNKVENQLRNLCKEPDEGGVSLDEEYSTGGEIDGQEAQTSSEDRELKERLLRKYGNNISSLKLEFSKKKKKGWLPKEAKQTLLAWWNLHYKWPYPTETDKISLAELTGLDQNQINNWFINQRKRHWKPSENMHLAVMSNLSGQFYMDD